MVAVPGDPAKKRLKPLNPKRVIGYQVADRTLLSEECRDAWLKIHGAIALRRAKGTIESAARAIRYPKIAVAFGYG